MSYCTIHGAAIWSNIVRILLPFVRVRLYVWNVRRGIETAKEEKKRRTILSARRPICSDRSALGYNGHLPVQPRSFILFLFLSCLFLFVSLLMTAITLSTSLCLSFHPKKIYGRELPRLQEIEKFKTLGWFVSNRETRLSRKWPKERRVALSIVPILFSFFNIWLWTLRLPFIDDCGNNEIIDKSFGRYSHGILDFQSVG